MLFGVQPRHAAQSLQDVQPQHVGQSCFVVQPRRVREWAPVLQPVHAVADRAGAENPRVVPQVEAQKSRAVPRAPRLAARWKRLARPEPGRDQPLTFRAKPQ